MMMLPLLIACAAEEPRPAAPAAAPAPSTAAHSGPSPLDAALAAQEGYVYNPVGKTDPFRAFLGGVVEGGRCQPGSPTQRYELDQYRVVGLIWGVDRPRALVEDPTGAGHVVEQGSYLGCSWGRISAITDEEIRVVEEYLTPEGALVTAQQALPLPKG